VTFDGSEQGPLDNAGVKALVSQGRIGPDTPIRRDDMASPVPAARVKGLLPATAAPARPAPGAADQPRPLTAAIRASAAPAAAGQMRPPTSAIRKAVAPAPAAASDNPFAAPQEGATVGHAPDDADHAELAGRGRRWVAQIVDSVIMIVLFIGVFGLLFAVSGTNDGGAPILIGSLLGMAAFVAINAWFLHSRGQTLGKMVMGVRIVRIDGNRTTGVDTIIKRLLPVWLLGLVPLAGPIFNLVDVLFIFREDRRCIHDLIAGTQVVVAAPRPKARPAAERGTGRRARGR
jgi:uncharacterized RDD family membrane protein YckC